ncbi:hypothetical protein ACH5A3_21145 [Streptomyces echinatus]|uniref:hypothetical protein n=1 Tax=Streptomyces echinatus TaxID=67293 RepID=UPI0037A79849
MNERPAEANSAGPPTKENTTMGYTTTFEGQVTVTPPLNPHEIAILRRFADSRRHRRPEGPYSTRDYAYNEVERGGYNQPPEGQPGLWCDWEPTDDGAGIRWNGSEKFYEATAWMQYLIDHFLKPGAAAKGQPGFEEFTFDHVVSGVIHAQGDEPGDAWDLTVVDNQASGASPR